MRPWTRTRRLGQPPGAGSTGSSRALRLEVVAEGVEDARQLEVLAELGCDRAQGFLLAHPVSASEIEGLRARWNGAPSAI